ncbi:T6SS effector amidase Tae4 family protein [Flavobacterium humi]|uniref:SWIM-type domain-containing protein n=1 Tax=Flavobacterium humi TaxID=2562683 RepID=A0A4Z0L8J3_9FLAO|nr:T6SS effector amidase Tae4 family protein [Flavobacterium humi]TGD58588.1 hypothetical protein E4635_06655 [Flavobacterium humi]
MKIKIPLQLFLTLILSTFICCTKDSQTTENQNQNIHTITFDELKSKIESAPKIIQKLQNAKNEIASNRIQGGFKFELDSIKEFKGEENYKSYTIKARKSNLNETEFIYKLLIENRNNVISSCLITFDYRNKLLVPINKEVFVLDNPMDRMECYAVTFIVECTCHEHSAPCTHPSSYTYHYCSGSNGGGETTNITNINGGVTTVGTSGTNSTVAILSEEEALELYAGFTNALTTEQKTWLSANPITSVELFAFFTTEGFSGSKRSFAKQAINYIMLHPTITFKQYKNWFSNTAVGSESDETRNTAYWNNPSLTFPQQTLPSFDTFYSAYPSSSTSAQQLCTQIGGQILTVYNKIAAKRLNMNTCAIRMSRALNYSGVTIPNVPGTKIGDDGKYYFTFAGDMNTWMRKTFGTNTYTGVGPTNINHHNYTQNQILNNPMILSGIKGIFSMVSSNPVWSTGHCDLLFNDVTCLNNCHFEGPILYIDVWELN